jgi:hypothetical protein
MPAPYEPAPCVSHAFTPEPRSRLLKEDLCTQIIDNLSHFVVPKSLWNLPNELLEAEIIKIHVPPRGHSPCGSHYTILNIAPIPHAFMRLECLWEKRIRLRTPVEVLLCAPILIRS